MVMTKNPLIMATCLLLLSSLALQTYASTFGPDECCFKFISKPLQKKRVMSYRYTESLCPMEGVLFSMKIGKVFCVDPSQQWVKDTIKALDRDQTKGKKNSTATPFQ